MVTFRRELGGSGLLCIVIPESMVLKPFSLPVLGVLNSDSDFYSTGTFRI